MKMLLTAQDVMLLAMTDTRKAKCYLLGVANSTGCHVVGNVFTKIITG
ncbi:MAG: hypothetical protein ACKPKQ_00160 [Dolichospermum sp.]